VLTTDRQRLIAARQARPLPPPSGDKAKLGRVTHPRPVLPPLVVHDNTWVIRGKDGTYLGLSFGDGREVQQLNLYDHLPAERVPRLNNYVFDLTGILPDAVGLDLGVTAGASIGFGAAGINFIWHTRGEATGRARYPEWHVYHGWGFSLTAGAIVDSFKAGINAMGAVQLIIGWAVDFDSKGVRRPAPNEWVANGYNWTGYFYNIGVAIPVYGKFSLVGSYFQSVPYTSDYKGVTVWRGVSIGVGFGVGTKFIKTKPFVKIDVFKSFDWRVFTRSMSGSRTEFGMVYGNGRDFMPKTHESLDGWHSLPGINQNDY